MRLARIPVFCGPVVAGADIEQAYIDMYNLQFTDAHRAIGEYEATHPTDPLGPVSDAAACLFSEFNRLHILQSEFFTDDASVAGPEKLRPDPAVKAQFEQDLAKTERLAAAEKTTLRLGVHADYLALIEKRELAALAEMKQGRQPAEQLLSRDPHYYDAYIAVGIENYLLSSKPAPHVEGIDSNNDGIKYHPVFVAGLPKASDSKQLRANRCKRLFKTSRAISRRVSSGIFAGISTPYSR